MTQGVQPERPFDSIESIASIIDRVALSAGSFSAPPSHLPLPHATWLSILRSRRLRVLDWIIGSGFRLLNLLPNTSEHFLAFAEGHDLQNKYSVARELWRSMRVNFQDFGSWLDALAETEILLVELHEPRPPSISPEKDSDTVILSAGVRLVSIDPNALELHDSISEFSIPNHQAAAELLALRQRFPRPPPMPHDVLVVPPNGEDSEGTLVQLEAATALALSGTKTRPMRLGKIRSMIGHDLLEEIIQLGALSRCTSK